MGKCVDYLTSTVSSYTARRVEVACDKGLEVCTITRDALGSTTTVLLGTPHSVNQTPIGLANSPATFHRLMEHVYQGIVGK